MFFLLLIYRTFQMIQILVITFKNVKRRENYTA